MNQILFISSYLCGLIIVFQLLNNFSYDIKYLRLFVILTIGIIVSLLNHGSTSNIFKYIDRLCMSLILFYLIILLYVYPNLRNYYYLLILAILLYLVKFVYKNRISYLMCHIIITVYIYLFVKMYNHTL